MLNLTEAFGSWILDTNKGLWFGVTVTLLAGWIAFKSVFGSVTILFGKDFECAMAVPDGLGTKCVEYVQKRSK